MSNNQQRKAAALFDLASAPLSPITSNDDDQDWITELLAKSAPMTTTNSYTAISELPKIYGNNYNDINLFQQANLDKYFDNESLFSGNEFISSSETSQINSPHVKLEDIDEISLLPDLNRVNNKLESLQEAKDFTSKSLESIFDTKDILKEESLSRTTSGIRRAKLSSFSNTSTNAGKSSSSISKLPKKRNPRKRLTDTQKQAHNKIEKKYRININAKIAGLQQIIPWVAFEKTAFETGDSLEDSTLSADMACNRLNKSMILEKATDYILYLQQNEQRILQENDQLKKEVARLGGSI